MAKIAGVDVIVQVEDDLGVLTTIGGQNSASIELNSESINVTDKNSQGWSSSISGVLSYSISCEGFWVTDDVALGLLEQKFMNREMVNVSILMPTNKKYNGTCMIASMPLELGMDSAVSYSLSLVGVGPLEITP
jgi:TP901-1 family phage major tail protein